MVFQNTKSNLITMGLKSILLPVFIFGMSCCSSGDDDPGAVGQTPTWGNPIPLPDVSGGATFTLSGTDDYVNVMEDFLPDMPPIPTVRLKEGKMIGFVADLSGKPLKGAFVGVRSSIIGGTYSSASAETDENGYYEILVPFGAAEVWAAGYSFSYGTGKAGVGLYPADGELETFESTKGLVKNFVLLSCGLADKDLIAEKPWAAGGYFGGPLLITYTLGDPDDIWAPTGSLPFDAEIEITLTPIGSTIYGESRTFRIYKKVGNMNFTINNLPIGSYTLTAKLKDGRDLRIRQIGPYVSLHPHHGLKPKDAIRTADVWFTPMGVGADSGRPNYGNWRPVDIKLELP